MAKDTNPSVAKPKAEIIVTERIVKLKSVAGLDYAMDARFLLKRRIYFAKVFDVISK